MEELLLLVDPVLPTHCRCRGSLLPWSLSMTYTQRIPPLDGGSARRSGLYMHNTQHSQQINIHAPAGFELALPGGERPQTARRPASARTHFDLPKYNLKISRPLRLRNLILSYSPDSLNYVTVLQAVLWIRCGRYNGSYSDIQQLLRHNKSLKLSLPIPDDLQFLGKY